MSDKLEARVDWKRSYYAEADNSDALRKECERLRHALEIVAAQHSGKVGSTKLSDCMAKIAKAALNA